MAYMEHVADVNGGTGSVQEYSSWTDTTQYGSTLYKTYQFTVSEAAGCTFVRWEVRSRYSYSTSDGSSTGTWSSWSTLSTSANFTRDFECAAESHGSIWGDSQSWYDREVRAVFTQNTYAVAVQVSADSPNGSGSVSGGGSFHYGDSCTVTATASSGFKFKKWTTSDSAQAAALSTISSYTFTVTANVTLYAHFKVGGTGQLIHGSSNTLLHGSSGTLLYDD